MSETTIDPPDDLVFTIDGPFTPADEQHQGYLDEATDEWVDDGVWRTIDMSAVRRLRVEARCLRGGVHGYTVDSPVAVHEVPGMTDRIVQEAKRAAWRAIQECRGHRNG